MSATLEQANPYSFAESQRLARLKILKRTIARSERIRREGLTPEQEPRCPVCNAAPSLGFNGRRNPGYCTRPGGRDPLPGHGTHKARDEARATVEAMHHHAADLARKELATLDRTPKKGARARPPLPVLPDQGPEQPDVAIRPRAAAYGLPDPQPGPDQPDDPEPRKEKPIDLLTRIAYEAKGEKPPPSTTSRIPDLRVAQARIKAVTQTASVKKSQRQELIERVERVMQDESHKVTRENAEVMANPRDVQCPYCKAQVHSPCRQPSGHAMFGKDHHKDRKRLAVDNAVRAITVKQRNDIARDILGEYKAPIDLEMSRGVYGRAQTLSYEVPCPTCGAEPHHKCETYFISSQYMEEVHEDRQDAYFINRGLDPEAARKRPYSHWPNADDFKHWGVFVIQGNGAYYSRDPIKRLYGNGPAIYGSYWEASDAEKKIKRRRKINKCTAIFPMWKDETGAWQRTEYR